MKTIFVDRDGCVNTRLVGDWVRSWDAFEFMHGAIEGIAKLKKAGYRLVLITNQRCIALGSLTREELDVIHNKMQDELKLAGGFFDSIYVCPHDNHENCHCRKPAPGMITDAARDYGDIDLSTSIMLGDRDIDRQAAESAGCGGFHMISDDFTINDAADTILSS